MSEKIYLNGAFLREKEFESGGSIIKCDILKVAEFTDQLISHANKDGKIVLDIKKRQEKSDTGITHYIEVSRYVAPIKDNQQQQKQQTEKNPFTNNNIEKSFKNEKIEKSNFWIDD